MPIPLTTCVLCKKQVSKRSTLDLAMLGAGEGRACRSHEAVAKLVEGLAAQAKTRRELTALEWQLKVIKMAAAIRFTAALRGLPLESFYREFALAGCDAGTVNALRQEIDRQGGVPTTREEFADAYRVVCPAEA